MTHTDWQEPFTRFGTLFDEAKKLVSKDPNAVSLATVDAQGRPSVRMVLLKEFDARGFVFYTNQQSAKGEALKATRVGALNFYWPALDQQVRVEGTVELMGEAEADVYFASRPRVSQLGAWASEQSKTLSSREELEQRLAALTAKYEGKPVPRPPHWGGFRLKPERMEFWKAHEFRLHWREQYVKSGDGWDRGWLNP
ncbi:MAG: pyridoxamine 5'-phosphate oxidase [Archangium sp.]|nr:pyridoxamine 5'-phosphate oxidase [Archangium sp.]